MPRGGARKGTPGKAYSNRSDLNKSVPIAAASGQTYGRRAEQVAAQRAIPISGPQPSSAPPPPQGPAGAAGPTPAVPPPPMPGSTPGLLEPTMRPGEPVTAGLGIGAGPGTEALGALAPGGDDVGVQLRAIYSRFPSEDLRQLIEMLDEDDGSGLS